MVMKAVGHMALIQDNVSRTSWLAASLLSPDPGVAQAAALNLHRHLLSIAPARRTAFEQAMAENDTYMANMMAFATGPAVCIWQNHGAYKPLFRFLAVRFLLAPDQVLDCERGHARWNWVCSVKRSLHLKSLNALLRLKHFLETHNHMFPPPEVLAEPLRVEIKALRAFQRRLDLEDRIAPRLRQDWPFLERFNLRSADIIVVGDGMTPAPGIVTFRSDYLATTGVYLRDVLRQGYFSPSLA